MNPLEMHLQPSERSTCRLEYCPESVAYDVIHKSKLFRFDDSVHFIQRGNRVLLVMERPGAHHAIKVSIVVWDLSDCSRLNFNFSCQLLLAELSVRFFNYGR